MQGCVCAHCQHNPPQPLRPSPCRFCWTRDSGLWRVLDGGYVVCDVCYGNREWTPVQLQDMRTFNQPVSFLWAELCYHGHEEVARRHVPMTTVVLASESAAAVADALAAAADDNAQLMV
jgi:hypothetical protein